VQESHSRSAEGLTVESGFGGGVLGAGRFSSHVKESGVSISVVLAVASVDIDPIY
jgi:hypothetical protein